MVLKSKNILVILFSSVIIAIVLLSTLLGYSLYVEWKNDSRSVKYNNSMYILTAEMFKSDIVISNVVVRMGEHGPFRGQPIIEGDIKNNSPKPVNLLTVEVFFENPDGSVVYKDRLLPLGGSRFAHSTLFSGVEPGQEILLPGNSKVFRHIFRNCPPEVVQEIASKASFAKNESDDKMKIRYSITEMSVL
jgi:hypothetical protein